MAMIYVKQAPTIPLPSMVRLASDVFPDDSVL